MNEDRNGNMNQTMEKKDTQGFGIASMVLGIISLLLFCTCVNWITGILAIVFGILQLVRGREKGFAIAGIITAALSILLAIILYLSVAMGMAQAKQRSFSKISPVFSTMIIFVCRLGIW